MNPEDTQETPEELKVPKPAYDFRFIKLSNGEEILCQVPVTQVEDLLLVRLPLKVNTMYDPTLGEAIYVFTPWIPFTGQELISVNKFSVVTVTTVRKGVQEIYLKKIESYQSQTMQQVDIPNMVEEEQPVNVTVEPPEPKQDPELTVPMKKKAWVN